MHISRLSPLICCLLLLAGCASWQSTPNSKVSHGLIQAKEPLAMDASAAADSNQIYLTLASEIALQRSAFPEAFTYALKAARESRDPLVAERATQIALHANLTGKALKAAELWIELAPESLKAHQISALIYSRRKQLAAAAEHLQQVVRLANQQGGNGYLQAAAIAEKANGSGSALALMQAIIPPDTRDQNALYTLALSASKAKQYPVAESYIRKALQETPGNTKNLLLLSHILIRQGKTTGISLLKQALDESPENQELRLSYARKLVEAQQLETALDQFEILDQQSPDNPEIIYAIGVLQNELNRPEIAEVRFRRLIEMQQKPSEAHFHLGLIEENRGANETALNHFQQVNGKNSMDARLRMAQILVRTDQMDKARELLGQMRTSLPSQEVRLYLYEADLLRDKRLYRQAHELYNRALQSNPDNHDLLYARALNAVDIGRIDILEQDLREILDESPDHADALNALGYTLADQTDRLDEAKDYIQRALTLKPDNPAILDSMGWVEFRLGNLAVALDYLQQAAKINPDAEIAAHLGEVLWLLDRKQQALDVWRKANEADAENPFIGPVMQRLGASE